MADETQVHNFTVFVLGHNLQKLLIGFRECGYVGCERALDKDGFVLVHIGHGVFGTSVVVTTVSPHLKRVAAPYLSVEKLETIIQ